MKAEISAGAHTQTWCSFLHSCKQLLNMQTAAYQVFCIPPKSSWSPQPPSHCIYRDWEGKEMIKYLKFTYYIYLQASNFFFQELHFLNNLWLTLVTLANNILKQNIRAILWQTVIPVFWIFFCTKRITRSFPAWLHRELFFPPFPSVKINK